MRQIVPMDVPIDRMDLTWRRYLLQTPVVIDDEIMRRVGRYLQGIKVNDDTLALELVQAVGPGGIFVGKAHTALHLREELLVEGLIRGSGEGQAGDLRFKARQKAKEILQ